MGQIYTTFFVIKNNHVSIFNTWMKDMMKLYGVDTHRQVARILHIKWAYVKLFGRLEAMVLEARKADPHPPHLVKISPTAASYFTTILEEINAQNKTSHTLTDFLGVQVLVLKRLVDAEE